MTLGKYQKKLNCLGIRNENNLKKTGEVRNIIDITLLYHVPVVLVVSDPDPKPEIVDSKPTQGKSLCIEHAHLFCV